MWVKSRLLKLDLRSFDWSSASFGHWILVYRMSECIVHTCGRAAHSLSASEWPLTLPRRWKSTCFVCSRQIFFRSNLTSISYRFNSSWNVFMVGYLGRLSFENWWYLKPPGTSEFFSFEKLSALTVGPRFRVASHHLCTFEGLVVHRTLTAPKRCRASERLATVVTFRTFSMGELKRLKTKL